MFFINETPNFFLFLLGKLLIPLNSLHIPNFPFPSLAAQSDVPPEQSFAGRKIYLLLIHAVFLMEHFSLSCFPSHLLSSFLLPPPFNNLEICFISKPTLCPPHKEICSSCPTKFTLSTSGIWLTTASACLERSQLSLL